MIDTDSRVKFDLEGVTGKHIAIFGMTGSGKTNTGHVWCEEEIEAGGFLTIMDPEGDYHYLKNKYPVLIIGCARRGNEVDIAVSPDAAEDAARMLAGKRVTIIVELSGFNQDQKDLFVTNYLTGLWSLYQFDDMPPQHLLIDEVHLFAPQRGKPPEKPIIQDIASRGRKRGLALVVATQRPQNMDATVRDATDIRFLHQVMAGPALRAYDELLPPNMAKQVPALESGQAILVRRDKGDVIRVRPSHTYASPGKALPVGLPLQNVDALLLDELKELMAHPKPAEVKAADKEESKLLAENLKLKEQVARLTQENQELCDQVKMLAGKVDVNIPAVIEQALATVEEEIVRSERSLKVAVGKQERAFESLLDQIGRNAPWQRQMLGFLIENEGKCFSIAELARYCGLSSNTIKNAPPHLLIIKGLLKRNYRNRTFHYEASVTPILAADYPDLDAEQLEKRLIEVCK